MSFSLSNVIKYGISITIVVLSIVMVTIHLDNPWLWFDEAGQFWISKGLNHYSEPFAASQDVLEVIKNNRYYNLDPGGFSILLHYWLMISNNYIFVRIFPLLFFIGFVFIFYKTLIKYNCGKFYAFVCAFLLFLWPITISRMVEVRAYSMSMLGFIWAIYYLKKCEESNYAIEKLFLLSLGLSFFCTARYESIIFAFPVSLYILYIIVRQKSKWLLKGIVYALPLIFTVGLIVLGSMMYQNASAKQVSYSYYLSSDKTLFYGKLFLFYVASMLLIVYDYYRNRKLSQLQIITILCPTTFILLSILGKYPWNNIRTISVLLVLLLNLIVFVFKQGYKYEYAKICFIVVALYVLGGGNLIQKTGLNQYDAFVDVVKNKNDNMLVYVDDWFEPSIRYAYEYGNFTNRLKKDNYPIAFFFQAVEIKHSGKSIVKSYSDLPSQTDADIYLIGRHYLDAKEVLKQDPNMSNVFRRETKY